MKKLPKVYQNNITKNINNNKSVCYLKQEDDKTTNINNITDTINAIFNGMGYAYNIPLTIKTNNNTYNTSLVTKTKYNVITLDNDIIPISDIIDIKINK